MLTITCIFVLFTLMLTTISTVLMSVSLLSNYWEHVTYNETLIFKTAKEENHNLSKIGNLFWLDTGGGIKNSNDTTETEESSSKIIYLIAAYGGVNSLCADISGEERKRVRDNGIILEPCISYLNEESVPSNDAWLDRMRNLAMSCSIVSLILLGSSAPLGLLGVFKKQISTIMVTGVMYILSAVFGIFTLAFMYFKRIKPDGIFTNTVLDQNVPEVYLEARQFSVGWPSAVGWAGISLCLTSSLFWLLLAKIMRFQILSAT